MARSKQIHCSLVRDGVFVMAELVNPEEYENQSENITVKYYDTKYTQVIPRNCILQFFFTDEN